MSSEVATATNRRPLKAREWAVIREGARRLGRTRIAPNQISIASVVFSGLAALCLVMSRASKPSAAWALCLLAVIFILCRALCNIFDGMMAVEGGRSTSSGELFNDIPDRISDPLILVAVGYATPVVGWAPTAGWCAALLAVLTAYVRTLARSLGAPADFRGPMGKSPRMVTIVIACLVTPLESLLWRPGYVFLTALLVIIAGCTMTIWRRTRAAYRYLERRPNV